MSILTTILKKETKRLKALAKTYRAELKTLPKGTVSLKKIRNGNYAYRVYRKGPKLRFEYLGKASSEGVREIQAQIRARRKIESLMSRSAKNLREVLGVLRGHKG